MLLRVIRDDEMADDDGWMDRTNEPKNIPGLARCEIDEL